MTLLNRFRNWWTNQYRSRGRLGKLVWLAVPLLFGCCALSMLSVAFNPPDAEPTAELAQRAATLEVTGTEPTEQPTSVPPTDEPTISPSPSPMPTDTPAPTSTTPPPTATPVPLTAYPEIVTVNKRGEYVDIRNNTGTDVMMTGWVLLSERGPQTCPLDGVGLFPAGYTLRVYAMSRPPADGEFSCGFDTEIWNNSESDPAVLLAPGGVEVSRR